MNNFKDMQVRQLVETARIYADCFEARGMSESAEMIRALAERVYRYAVIMGMIN